MKKKIVLLPLDERPCNYIFPNRLFCHEEIEIIRPDCLGYKKQPADRKKIAEFLRKECKDADGLILSVDMMLYGGLVPSRIHNTSVEQLKEQAALIKILKKENPELLIYAFQVIMRCPDYSSDDEEPDYYGTYGKMIHMAGDVVHRSRLGICEGQELEHILGQIDCEKLNDYVSRRECNRELNYTMLQYVKNGWIDMLIIPQDDSAAYGYAAMDQEAVRTMIAKAGLLDKVLMYPGADEVALTLTARMCNHIHGRKPKVYVKYASEGARKMIPLYEGNTLETTIKYQIMSAGCQMTDSYEHSDFILAITAPSGEMAESADQPYLSKGYCIERNLPELVDFMKNRIEEEKIITIGDNGYANGGDLQLIQLLDQNSMLDKVAGYAGWNTSANTLGTAIAQGVDFYYYGPTAGHMNFLMERYIEDTGYCSCVRKIVTQELDQYGMNYFDVKEEEGLVSKRVTEELSRYIETNLASIAGSISLDKVRMPWKRMFEAEIEASYHKRQSGERS